MELNPTTDIQVHLNLKGKEFANDGDDSTQSKENTLTILVRQLLDVDYGCYIWPSAFVLAMYIYRESSMFQSKAVLELGSGTGLPSLVLSKIALHFSQTTAYAQPKFIMATDKCSHKNALNNLVHNFLLNQTLSENVDVSPLQWGNFIPGVDCSVPSNFKRILSRQSSGVDYILAADCFYDPVDFEKLISTVAYILSHSSRAAKFITSYQERSPSRSISTLLERFGLKVVGQYHVSELSQDVHVTVQNENQKDPIPCASQDGFDNVFVTIIAKD